MIASDNLPIMARQAISVLGIELLQDIARRASDGATGQMTLNFYNGAIPSWTMLERHERKKKDAACGG